MKIRTRCFVFSVFCLLSSVICPLTYAAVPHLLNYQGRLTDPSGAPLNGSYAITFRIYDAETAGNLLWEETQAGVLVQKGIFNILLGSVTNLGLAFDKPYFLEIKVGNEVMNPRQRIASAGYAIRAEKAEDANTVGNVGVSTAPVANKILPLDNNGKIPQSVIGLKTYDSGWFAVTTGTKYDRTHNLGTTKVIIQIYIAQNSDGSGWCTTERQLFGFDLQRGIVMCGLTNTTISIRTGIHGIMVNVLNAAGNEITGNNCYARIIMLALE